MEHRSAVQFSLAMGVLLLFWSSAFAAIRVGLEGYSPGQLALLRFLTASVVLGLIAGVRRTRLPAWRDVPIILLLGGLGIAGYHVALNTGEMTVSAGVASLLIASAPIFTALLSALLLRERLRPLAWVGVAVGFGGIALIVFGAGRGLALGPGALVVLGASLCASLYNVLQKRNMGRYAPLEFTTYVIWAGTLPLLVYLPGLVGAVRSAPLGATVAVVYLGIFPGAIAYTLWVYALSRLSASVLSSWLYLNPVLAIAIAWIWLGEIPAALSFLGGAVAVGGVVLVAFFGRRPDPDVVPEVR
jgi:drug/metabolite transporter (DMT)-like permease